MGAGPTYEEEQEFIANLGQAIVDWQAVEHGAYAVFKALSKNSNPKLTSVIFHHLQSFESRITLLNKCAHFTIPKGSLADRWDKKKATGKDRGLRKRLLDAMEARNRLVHFSFITGRDENGPVVRLGPSFSDATYAINDRWKNPDFDIRLDDLRDAQRDFRALGKDLSEFAKDLKAIL